MFIVVIEKQSEMPDYRGAVAGGSYAVHIPRELAVAVASSGLHCSCCTGLHVWTLSVMQGIVPEVLQQQTNNVCVRSPISIYSKRYTVRSPNRT